MLNPQDTDGLEQDTVTLYQWAEMGLLGVLGSLILELKDTPVWGTGELLALARKRRDIQRIVTTLEQKAPRLLAAVVDEAYKLGATAAQAEVAAIPDEHKPTPQPHTPTDPRRYATDTMGKLTPLHRNIYRTTDDIWRRIVREATQKALTGKIDTFTAAQQAFTSMAREGLGYFVDSRGRRWGLDTYAEMAVRSAANEALRAGHWDELTASGIDLVVVSSHKNPAPVCAPYERKVLSLTGKYAPGTHTVDGRTVQVKATLQQAEAAGLHHPNAILGGDQLINTFAKSVGASKSAYRGPSITISTAKGALLTVSPKHPILSGRGWVTAESLRPGDNLFHTIGSDRFTADTGDGSHVNYVPTTVEDEFVAIKKVGASALIPSAGHNFNDDRKFVEGEIDVVVTDHCLLPVPDTHVIEESGKVTFTWPDMGRGNEVGNGTATLHSIGVPDSVGRPLPDTHTGSNKPAANSGVGDSEHGCDILAARSGSVEGLGSFNVDRNIPFLDVGETGIFQHAAYARAGDSHDPRDVCACVPGGVELDEVVVVDRGTFVGHAYDFQTLNGIYVLNNIVVHNCRHTTSAYIPGYTNLKPTAPPDPSHEGYEATQKQRYLERQIRASRRMEQAALNEHDKAQAVARRKAYEKKLREHVREWDLPRRKHREQVRVPGDEVTF